MKYFLSSSYLNLGFGYIVAFLAGSIVDFVFVGNSFSGLASVFIFMFASEVYPKMSVTWAVILWLVLSGSSIGSRTMPAYGDLVVANLNWLSR